MSSLPDDPAPHEGDQAGPPQGSSATEWKDLLPWEPGHAKTADKVLLGFLLGVPIFYMILLPMRPFLIAKIPLAFSVISGAKTVVAGAGAFASVEGHSIWLVVLAGWIGMSKFDWLFWYAGWRWGTRVVDLFTQSPQQRRQAEYIRRLPRWLLSIFIFLGRWPGIPGSIAGLIAGWGRMSVWMFLTANLLGNLLLSGICAYIGYAIGERAVEFLRTIDRYALWVSLAIIVGTVFWSSWRASRARS